MFFSDTPNIKKQKTSIETSSNILDDEVVLNNLDDGANIITETDEVDDEGELGEPTLLDRSIIRYYRGNEKWVKRDGWKYTSCYEMFRDFYEFDMLKQKRKFEDEQLITIMNYVRPKRTLIIWLSECKKYKYQKCNINGYTCWELMAGSHIQFNQILLYNYLSTKSSSLFENKEAAYLNDLLVAHPIDDVMIPVEVEEIIDEQNLLYQNQNQNPQYLFEDEPFENIEFDDRELSKFEDLINDRIDLF